MGQKMTKLQMGLIRLHTKFQPNQSMHALVNFKKSNIQPEEIQNSDQDSDSYIYTCSPIIVAKG